MPLKEVKDDYQQLRIDLRLAWSDAPNTVLSRKLLLRRDREDSMTSRSWDRVIDCFIAHMKAELEARKTAQ